MLQGMRSKLSLSSYSEDNDILPSCTDCDYLNADDTTDTVSVLSMSSRSMGANMNMKMLPKVEAKGSIIGSITATTMSMSVDVDSPSIESDGDVECFISSSSEHLHPLHRQAQDNDSNTHLSPIASGVIQNNSDILVQLTPTRNNNTVENEDKDKDNHDDNEKQLDWDPITPERNHSQISAMSTSSTSSTSTSSKKRSIPPLHLNTKPNVDIIGEYGKDNVNILGTPSIPSPLSINRLTRGVHRKSRTSRNRHLPPPSPSRMSHHPLTATKIEEATTSIQNLSLDFERDVQNRTKNSHMVFEDDATAVISNKSPVPSPSKSASKTPISPNTADTSLNSSFSTSSPVPSPSRKNKSKQKDTVDNNQHERRRQSSIDTHSNPVLDLLNEEMNLSSSQSAPFELPPAEPASPQSSPSPPKTRIPKPRSSGQSIAHSLSLSTSSSCTKSVSSSPGSSPNRKNKKKKGVLRKTSAKLKNILKVSTSKHNDRQQKQNDVASTTSSTAGIQNSISSSRAAPPSVSEVWLTTVPYGDIGANDEESLDPTPPSSPSDRPQSAKVLIQDAQEDILMGSPLKLADLDDAGKKKNWSLIRSSSFSHRRRKNDRKSNCDSSSNRSIHSGGSVSGISTSILQQDFIVEDKKKNYSPYRKKANLFFSKKIKSTSSSNLNKNNADTNASQPTVSTQDMNDNAINGRLDGMDVISLGAARKVSYISSKQKHFAGQRYTPRSMVTDMMVSSCGQDYPELVLEGFTGKCIGRWIVSGIQYSHDNKLEGRKNNSTSEEMAGWSGLVPGQGFVDQGIPDHNDCNNEDSTQSRNYDNNDKSEQKSISSTPDFLLAQMWGKDKPPPPSHSLQFLATLDDADEIDCGNFVSCPVDVDEDIYVFDNDDHLHNVHEAAVVPLRAGKVEKCITIFEKILRSITSVSNSHITASHHLLGSVFHNIGILKMWAGHYEDARKSLSKAVRVRKQVLGIHASLAVSYAKLGLVYFALEQMDNALAAFENALEIRKRVVENEHLELAKLSNNIGAVHYQKGKYTTALKYFTEALQIQRKWTAKPIRRQTLIYETAVTLSNLGKIYLELEDYDMAFYVFEEALMLQTTSFSKDHDIILTSLGNIAFAKVKRGEKSNALQIYKSIHRAQVSKYGDESCEGAETMGLISGIHIQQCNYKLAKQCLEIVLKWQKKNLDEHHPATLNTENMITKITHGC